MLKRLCQVIYMGWLFSPLANAQEVGPRLGWLSGWDGNVVHYSEAVKDAPAEWVGPGWTLGFMYAGADSAVHLVVECDWSHQSWEDRFVEPIPRSSSSGPHGAGTSNWFDYRRGTIAMRIDMIEVDPMVAWRKGRVRLMAGVRFGLVVNAWRSEGSAITSYAGSTSDRIDTSYHGLDRLNLSQFGPIAGVDVEVLPNWHAGMAYAVNLTRFVDSGSGVAQYLRLSIFRPIWRKKERRR